MKEVMRFQNWWKLIPCYIGLYQIVRRIGNVLYELDLPVRLALIYLIFHISMLKKYVGGPFLILLTEEVGMTDLLSYEEVSIEILDRQVRRLRTKDAFR